MYILITALLIIGAFVIAAISTATPVSPLLSHLDTASPIVTKFVFPKDVLVSDAR